MTSYLPPADRIWWKVPVGREEIVWIAIALVWCLIMFFMMPYWHVYGKQNLSNEAYQTTPAKFGAKVQAMVDQYTVRMETEQQIPVVAPPAGSDIYMLGTPVAVVADPGTGKRQDLPPASLLHGLAARLFPAADQHQHAGRSRLRNGVDHYPRPGG